MMDDIRMKYDENTERRAVNGNLTILRKFFVVIKARNIAYTQLNIVFNGSIPSYGWEEQICFIPQPSTVPALRSPRGEQFHACSKIKDCSFYLELLKNTKY